MELPVYLDCHATTPLDPRVLEAMLPYFTRKFGNAASRSHSFGWEALEAVDAARREIARLINARPSDIIFTSGATESDNLAIKGAARARGARGQIITLATEHQAVLDACRSLEPEGFKITALPVQPDGLVDLNRLEDAITDETILVSIMAAHNETGVIQPITEIGRLCRRRSVLFHSDAVQAVGKIPVDVEMMNIDLMSLTAHKIYGPKGAGALYVRQPKSVAPLIDGGGHERGLRSGTLNVPGIVGLGAACELCRLEMPEESFRLAALRDRLRDGIFSRLENLHVNGSMEHRLPHNLNVSFDGVQADTLMMSLPEIAISAGSACHSANPEPSYVLKAMGVPDHRAYASLRFGLGRFTTVEEVDYSVNRIAEAVTGLRGLTAAAKT